MQRYMSTYCISKAKLFVRSEDISMFRKGDFFRQPHANLREEEIKGLLQTCRLSGKGFGIQNPLNTFSWQMLYILYTLSFFHRRKKTKFHQKDSESNRDVWEYRCSHAMMNTTISVFVCSEGPQISSSTDPFTDRDTDQSSKESPSDADLLVLSQRNWFVKVKLKIAYIDCFSIVNRLF